MIAMMDSSPFGRSSTVPNVIPRSSLSLFAAFALAPLLHAEAPDLQNLIDHSPFSAPVAQGATDAAPVNSVLEFRGMVADADGTSYSVFDTTANKARWLKVGEGDSFKVKQFDSANNQLEVEQQGKVLKLPLKRITIQAGPAIVSAPPPNRQPQPRGGPAAAPGDPAADANRLQTVAAEVRRRRAMRNTAVPAPAAAAPAPAK
jgi:hypothetical protein